MAAKLLLYGNVAAFGGRFVFAIEPAFWLRFNFPTLAKYLPT